MAMQIALVKEMAHKTKQKEICEVKITFWRKEVDRNGMG